MTDLSILFQPFKYKNLTLTNRIAMAPMTRAFSPDGVPGDNVAKYYARRAAADVGLIITEGTTIDRPGASDNPNYPNFHSEAALSGWKNVVDQVHESGGKIAPQIWHVGLTRKPGTGPSPDAASDSPSGITHTGKQVLPEPTDSEIADMIASYGRAAANAAHLGFDSIEIHGAHGYLIDQFLWDTMNKRADRFGGDMEARASFAAEVIKAVRKGAGENMPIILRYSQWKQQEYSAKLADSPDKLEKLLAVFVDAGVDILHCSTRRFWEPEFEGSDLNLAGWSKKLTGLPTITVGSVGLNVDFINTLVKQETSTVASLDNLVERMEREEFDLVAVGRALLQDPNWAQKVKEGRLNELEEYSPKARETLS